MAAIQNDALVHVRKQIRRRYWLARGKRHAKRIRDAIYRWNARLRFEIHRGRFDATESDLSSQFRRGTWDHADILIHGHISPADIATLESLIGSGLVRQVAACGGDPSMETAAARLGWTLQTFDHPQDADGLCKIVAVFGGDLPVLVMRAGTVLSTSALEWMLSALGQEIAAVCPKIVDSRGVIQAAGFSCFDGNTVAIGQGAATYVSGADFVRVVDGVSLVCALLSPEFATGLSNERHASVQEDVIVCAPAARTFLFQPESVVIVDSPGRERFGAALRRIFLPAKSALAPKGAAKRRVLYIEHDVPKTDRDAGAKADFEIVSTLAGAGWEVTYWPIDPITEDKYRLALTQAGIEVVCDRVRPSLSKFIAAARPFDYAVVCRPDVSFAVSDVLRTFNLPTIYFGHDLYHVRMRLGAQVTQNKGLLSDAMWFEYLEREAWKNSVVQLYPTADEVAVVQASDPAAVPRHLTIFCFDALIPRVVPPAGAGILFVGGFGHPPNADAVVWFCQEIMPVIRAKCADARFRVIGSRVPDEIRSQQRDDIEIVGWASEPELEAAYHRARVVVVPLRFGAGLKLKVVEAMAMGVPVVTTPIGAQGLEQLADLGPVTDNAETFAESVLHILAADAETWMAKSAAQQRLVQTMFGRQVMLASLLDAFAVVDRNTSD